MEYIEPTDFDRKPMLWFYLRIAELSYGELFRKGYSISAGLVFDIAERYGDRAHDRDKWYICELILSKRYKSSGVFFPTDFLIGVNSEEGVRRAIERWNGLDTDRVLTVDSSAIDFEREALDLYYELKEDGVRNQLRLDTLKFAALLKGYGATNTVSIDNSQKLLVAGGDKAEAMMKRLMDRAGKGEIDV